MHYVKYFTIKDVDTKQVACIELQGAPNAATEGAVGVLGIDITSPTHDVYKCVAVNGSVYTWELLSAGMSIISAKISREGALTSTFPYDQLVVPNNYILKVGDLILDSEGYLYRVTAIGADSCTVEYGNTHIGGMASGDKDRRLTVENGKLKLVTESGNVLSELDYLLEDNETIYRDPNSGRITAIGIKTVNGQPLRFFVGESSEFEKLTPEQKVNLYALITNDTTQEEWETWRESQTPTVIENPKNTNSITEIGLYAVVLGDASGSEVWGTAMLPIYNLNKRIEDRVVVVDTNGVYQLCAYFHPSSKSLGVSQTTPSGVGVPLTMDILHCRLIKRF